MDPALSVFLCSTFEDLSEERAGVLRAVRGLDLRPGAMELFGARAAGPVEACLAEVRRSDVLVIVVGHMYGTIAPGHGVSFSEAEYREGHRLGKPCLVYVRDDDAPVRARHVERDPEKARLLEAWRGALAERHVVAAFHDAPDLAAQVAADLGRTVRDLERARQELADGAPAVPSAALDAVADAVARGVPRWRVVSAVRRAVADLADPGGPRPPAVYAIHGAADAPFVRRVLGALRARGLDVVADEGPPTAPSAERALDAADYAAVFLSPEAADDERSRVATGVATARRVGGDRATVVVPVLLGDVSVPPVLRDAVLIDARGRGPDDTANALADAVLRHRLDRPHYGSGVRYANEGINIDPAISSWDDDRLFAYIEGVLEPEAWERARRDYERIWSGEEAEVREEADRKVEEAARHYGFYLALLRYRTARSGGPGQL